MNLLQVVLKKKLNQESKSPQKKGMLSEKVGIKLKVGEDLR